MVAPFRLFTVFQNEPPEPVRRAIFHEVEAIMEPIGWRVTWSSPNSVYGTSFELVVARFSGACNSDRLMGVQAFPSVLGATLTTNGNIEPYIDIYCDAVRALLAQDLFALGRSERDMAFGRAVGRIVGHELYHILGRTRKHASSGLGEAKYSAPELLAGRFHFGNREVQLLRANLVPVLLDYQTWVTHAPPPPGYSAYVQGGCSGCHGPHGEGTAWGPSLESAQKQYSADTLSTLLKSRTSEMYRRAQGLNLAWPRMGDEDIQKLAQFLQSLRKSSVNARLTQAGPAMQMH